jgi:alkanesulfonate monooxygenase SsuD/methylene tetrahydromethanopterin reductase-like flavin-dependent oxidoreductase (luciferase family)
VKSLFGLQLSAEDDLKWTARRAEELSFDYIGSPEHVVFRRPSLNAALALAVAAGATEQIRLISAMTVLPLYPAALAAKLISLLDVASNGRLDLGVGVGGDYPPEFDACGVPLAERAPRTDEALEVLRRLFTEDDVTFQGRFTTLTDVTIEPKPVQKPMPPIWIGGRSAGARRRAAKYGAWLPYLYSASALRRGVDEVRELCDGEPRIGVLVSLTVYQDDAKARRVAADFASRSYGHDFTPYLDKLLVAGDPARCIERLTEYVQAGAELVLAQITCEKEDRSEMLRCFGEDILGGLR